MQPMHVETPHASWKGNTMTEEALAASSLRGWQDAIAGTCPADAPNYIRQDPVLWSLYMYGYRAAKEALTGART